MNNVLPIRNIKEEAIQKFRELAEYEGRKQGKMFELILESYLKQQEDSKYGS